MCTHVRRGSPRNRPLLGLMLAMVIPAAAGCTTRYESPVVIFLEGAGNIGGAYKVEWGLREGGVDGTFENFVWSTFLGPPADHVAAGYLGPTAARLAALIEQIRESPEVGTRGQVHAIGLSAGCAPLLSAIERLPDGVHVDTVVLLAPSVSDARDLTPALRRIRRRLYATSSPHDLVLSSLMINADGRPGRPAGLNGFRTPGGLSAADARLYDKVVTLPWRPLYRRYGWSGGHLGVNSPDFIANVIAPRLANQ